MSKADRITPTAKKSVLFADFHLDFAKHPITGDLARQTNEDSVRRAIKNLVLTNLEERPYNLTVGGDVNYSLFELDTNYAEEVIKKRVESVIVNNESRVALHLVQVVSRPDNNGYGLSIYFSLINNPGASHQVDVIIQRIR